MILQLSSPSMEHTGESRQIGADMLGIEGQFFKSARGCLEESLIGHPLIGAAEESQSFRQGEGEHEIVARQTSVQLVV